MGWYLVSFVLVGVVVKQGFKGSKCDVLTVSLVNEPGPMMVKPISHPQKHCCACTDGRFLHFGDKLSVLAMCLLLCGQRNGLVTYPFRSCSKK